MKKIVAPLFVIVFSIWYLVFSIKQVEAKIITPTVEISPTATPTAVVTVNEVKTNLVEDKIEKVDYKLEKFNGVNGLKVLISWAMSRGVASNTIVLLLLLPLVATLISALHYL